MTYKEMLEKQARTKFIKLSMDQRKELANIYIKSAKEITVKLQTGGYTALTEAFYKSHAKNLKIELQHMMQKGVIKVADIPTEFHTLLWNDTAYNNGLNLSFDRMFATIPTKTLEQMLQGKIYTDGKGLSKRIWRAANEYTNNVRDIVMQAQLEKTSAVKTAKVLEEYLEPGAKKPWTRSKMREILGPGYASMYKTVDYNALRLARTTMTHSYEMAQIQAGYENPYTEGLLWHTSNSHYARQIVPFGEDECDDWEGTVFKLDEVPFDHPNGLCYQTTEFVSNGPKTLANDLKSWINDDYENGPGLLDGPDVLDNWWKKHGSKFGVSPPKAKTSGISQVMKKPVSLKAKETQINPKVTKAVMNSTPNKPKIGAPKVPKGFKFSDDFDMYIFADAHYQDFVTDPDSVPADILKTIKDLLDQKIKTQDKWLQKFKPSQQFDMKIFMKHAEENLDYVLKSGPGNKVIDELQQQSKKSLAQAKKAMNTKVKSTQIERSRFRKLSYSEYDNFMEDDFNAWMDKIDSTHRNAIHSYTGSSYKPINKYLRHGEDAINGLSRADEFKETADKLYEALNAVSVPDDIVVFRGSSKSALGSLKDLPPEKWIGSVIQDNGFMSTTVSGGSSFNGFVQMEILVPKGTPGAYISKMSKFKTERELLLQAGTKLRILDATPSVQNGSSIIKVQAIIEP